MTLKRLLAALTALFLCLCAAPHAALAQTPNDIPVLTDAEIPATPDYMHHYLLLCVDAWNSDVKNLSYTDGMVLVTVDTRANRVMLTSFIRDMLIWRPDNQFGRLNNVARFFSVDDLIRTLNTHFGIRIDNYILMDMQQVSNIIDAVGGVDITVTGSEASYLKRYSISASSTTPSMNGAGTYRFTGHAAVIYMRIRRVAVGGVSGDLMRTQRVRTVLSTMADQLSDITYDEANAILSAVVKNMRLTSMSPADMLSALDMMYGLRGVELEQIRMPIDGSWEQCSYAGMATVQIDYEANRAALHEYLFDSYVVVDDGSADTFLVTD